MSDNYRKTRLKHDDSLLEEALDRDGDWVREFSSRSIIWPLFEHWAAENGYRLVALRNKRRLYQFGRDGSPFITFLDVKQDGSQVRFKAWTQVRWTARVFWLWSIPARMNIDPQGFAAVRYRRHVCQQFNSLLARFGQPPILFSLNFHWADLDLSTLALIALLVTPLACFTYVSMPPFHSLLYQFDPEMLESMFSALGIRLAVLTTLAIVAFSAHQWLILKRYNRLWMKAASVAVSFLLVTSLSMAFRKGDDPAALKKTATLHCFYQFNDELCQKSLSVLSPEDRLAFKKELKVFYKELTRVERSKSVTR